MQTTPAPSLYQTSLLSHGSKSFIDSEADLSISEEQSKQNEWKPGRAEWLVVVSIFLLFIMIALDSTIIVPVLPTIASDLNGSAVQSFWVGTSFLLTNAVFQPFIGVLSDIFGRRAAMLTSVALFTAGTLIGGLAPNFNTLLSGRSIQGVGAGGIYVLGYIILSDIIPLKPRAKFMAIVQMAWAIGTILGPLIGGLFAEHTTWRWTFYINLPFCGIGFVTVPFAIKLKMKESSFWEKLTRVDWIGGFIFVGSTTVFLMAISWGGMQFAWNSVGTLAPLMVGAVGIVFTLWYEAKVASQPFLRRSLFYNRSAIAAYICTLIQGLELFVALYYLPIYFQAVKNKSPVGTGVSLFPVTSALIPASVVTAVLIGRLGRFRWAIWSGWALSTVSMGLLLLWDIDTKTPVWAAILVILGLSHGLILSSLNLAVQAIAKIENVAHAVTMYSFLRSTGSALGVGIGGAIFQNMMSDKLTSLGLPGEISKNAEGYIHILQAMPPTSSQKVGIQQSYVKGIHGVFIVMTALSGVAMIISFLIVRHSMDKLNQSDHFLGNTTNQSPSEVDIKMPIMPKPTKLPDRGPYLKEIDITISSPTRFDVSYFDPRPFHAVSRQDTRIEIFQHGAQRQQV